MSTKECHFLHCSANMALSVLYTLGRWEAGRSGGGGAWTRSVGVG